MIKLTDDYKIDFDYTSINLYKKHQNKKGLKGDYFRIVGYFGSFEHLIEKLLNDKIFEGNYKELKDIEEEIIKFKEEILNKIIEIQPDTKPYKYDLNLEE